MRNRVTVTDLFLILVVATVAAWNSFGSIAYAQEITGDHDISTDSESHLPPDPSITPIKPDGNVGMNTKFTRVSEGDGRLPNETGQVWREYDIRPYVIRMRQTKEPEQAIVSWDSARDRKRLVVLASRRIHECRSSNDSRLPYS